VERFVAKLGSSEPAPGGGSAAALAAACSSALAAMVAAITAERKGAAPALREEMERLGLAAQDVAARAVAAVDADAAAYDGVVAAMRLPKKTPEELAARRAASSAAARRAAEVPFELLRAVAGTLDGLEALARRGHAACASDLLGAATLAAAAAETAQANVAANLPLVDDRRWTRKAGERSEALRREVVRRAGAVAARGRRALAAAAKPARPAKGRRR